MGRSVVSAFQRGKSKEQGGQHGGEKDRQSAAQTPVADEQSAIQDMLPAIQATWPWMSELSAK